MSTKRIAIIGPAFPLRGGLATFNERMARSFISFGYTVEIFTFSLQYPNFLFPGKTQYSTSDPPNDLTIHICINTINPFSWINAYKALKKYNPHLIITRYWLPFMGPSLGSILKLIRSKVFAQDNRPHIMGLIDNAIPHEKRIGDSTFTSYFLSALDSCVTMSDQVTNDLKQLTSLPINQLQHPLYDNFGKKLFKPEARKKLHIDEDGFVFLFFGFIRHYKGLDMLIEAFDELHNNKKCHLLIAGEFYADEELIRSKIENCNNKDNIILHTHFIKDEDVKIYFSACDVVVQPYRTATQSGVTPLAYHFEIPMIVTNVGSLASLVPPSLGIVCDPNVEDIRKSLTMMIEFDTNHFYTAIKTEKKKLSWTSFIEKIQSLIPELTH